MTTPSQKTWVCLAFVCLGCITGQAATWYAAANGNSTNGTLAAPWSVPYSVTNTNPHLQPGDTVIFKTGGTYVCRETNTVQSVGSVLEFRRSGTLNAKITYRPESLWGFSFDGGLLLTASNLVIEQFHIHNSGIGGRVRSNQYLYPPGINDVATRNDILHNLIENTGHPGIGSWKTTRGKYIAGNIIRFTGINDYTGSYNGANRGSGMYLQNADNSSEALIQGNISYFNYTTGMKAYGNTDIWKFTFRNQICAENAEAGIFYHLDNYGSTNLTVDSNYLWRNGTGIRLGYPLGNSGHSNAVVAGNYVVDNGYSAYPFYISDGWANTTWTNNVGVSLADRYVWYLEVSGETGGNTASHHIDHNTYYGRNTGGFGTGDFFVKESGRSLAQWQGEVLGETNSTFTYGSPASLVTKVFRPSTDSNFVHVAVFNWPTNATTTVNLSAYFDASARLSIYDAQNIPTAYTNVNFNGSTVTLDLTLTNRATMLGTFSQRTDAWNGFDPRFRAFVIYRSGSRLAPPSSLQVQQ